MPKSRQIIHQLHLHHHHHHGGRQQVFGLASSPSKLHSLQAMSTGIATSSTAPPPPRKVSFEDGHSDDSASACSESSSELITTSTATTYCTSNNAVLFPLHHQQRGQQQGGEETKEVRLSRSNSSHKPRLLARHSPSLSLVDLARTLAMDDDDSSSGSGELLSSTNRKRPHSAPVSPITGVVLDPSRCLVASSCSNLLPPGMEESSVEPWGHFVDMALPEKKKLRSVPKTIPLTARASTKSSKRHSRRRLAKPYGDYHHTKLCFQPSSSTRGAPEASASPFGLSIPSSESLLRFYSSPSNSNNQEPTELIAGDLERLHFNGI